MTPQRYQLVKRIFIDVCRSDPGGRAALLERECGDDQELRTEVLSLLARDEREDSALFLEKPALDPNRIWRFDESLNRPRQPQRIGNYRVVEVLGEGGMGVVYLAEQDNPRRNVALKIIRPGIASERMMQRFEYESQILARLHHPGIAHVYEAGTADTGYGPQPFFAMEYVHGVGLGEIASQRNLTTRQRLELMIKICQAVHHAHQKGVIHRDLKPGNILVDESGQPKVLDFGIARMSDADPAHTLSSSAGQLVGTITYMSPEQVSGDSQDVDTRCDVYSLGVIGYELLSGKMPHDLDDRNLPECIRTIAEREPRPLSDVDGTFRGDLETIVGKALRNDPEQRYQSALELAEDIERFLQKRPIRARRRTFLYHAKKFVQRNPLVTAASIVAVLASVLAVNWWVSSTAASHTKGEVAFELARFYLQQNIRLAREKGGDPYKPPAGALELVQQKEQWTRDNLADQPEAAAILWDLLGQNYLLFQRYDDAERCVQQAWGLLNNVHPAPQIEIAQALHDMGRVLFAKGQFGAAEDEYRQALDLRAQTLGPEHEDIAMTMYHIAACLRSQNRLEDARAMYVAALDMRLKLLGKDDPDTIASYNGLAALAESEGNYADAAEEFSQAMNAIQRKFGPSDSRVLKAMQHIAACWIQLGLGERDARNADAAEQYFNQAEQYLGQALETYRNELGAEHRDAARTQYYLAQLYHARGQESKAEEYCRGALAIQERKLGQQHPETIDSAKLLEAIESGKSIDP